MSHMKAKKIKAFCEVNDARLFWRKGQTSWFEPLGKDVLHALGILFGFTEADEVIGVPHDRTLAKKLTSGVIFDPDGFFHSMERDIR